MVATLGTDWRRVGSALSLRDGSRVSSSCKPLRDLGYSINFFMFVIARIGSVVSMGCIESTLEVVPNCRCFSLVRIRSTSAVCSLSCYFLRS